MVLFRVMRDIYNHPFNNDRKIAAVFDFIKWQFNYRLSPFPIIYPFTEHSRLIIGKGQTGATGNLYSGLMEYQDMGFLLHFLRPKDLFLDIGANVGVYSVLASAEIKCTTIAVEPVPSTFKFLVDNIAINQIQDCVKALNIGLGSKKSKLHFTASLDTSNHVATENDKNTVEVNIETLDQILSDAAVPSLMKIDVEGFETEVLNGGNSTLQNEQLKAIIIELNKTGERYGFKDIDIHEKLVRYGFKPYSYDPNTRILNEMKSYGRFNTIYLRDCEFVTDRVSTARKIKIGKYLKPV